MSRPPAGAGPPGSRGVPACRAARARDAARAPWLSLHLHHGDDCYGPELDRLLLAGVGPCVERCLARGAIRSYFFLRYGEGGSHLRIRLQGSDPGSCRRELRRSLERHLGTRDIDLRAATYEPELGRYGGPLGLRVAEQLFHASSRVSLGVLGAGGGHGRRLGKTLLLAVVLAHTFFGGRAGAAAFLHRYAVGYHRLLRRCGRAAGPAPPGPTPTPELLAAVGRLLPALDTDPYPLLFPQDGHASGGRGLVGAWLQACLRARGGLHTLPLRPATDPRALRESIVASYLHVHHNRLGWSIPQEIHLCRLAAHTLDHLGACP
ncbi:MAG: thiopeptide-type bacteriocin biosynthesis protein [Holophagales bacterium]|nr:thiopeptide-type bacteriocin biosynthesis protein [Holophagales bacterium]